MFYMQIHQCNTFMICFEHRKKLKRICLDEECPEGSRLLCEDCMITYDHRQHETITLNRFQNEVMDFGKIKKKQEGDMKKHLSEYVTRSSDRAKQQIETILNEQENYLETKIEKLYVNLGFEQEKLLQLIANTQSYSQIKGQTLLELYNWVSSNSAKHLCDQFKQKQMELIEMNYFRLINTIKAAFHNHKLERGECNVNQSINRPSEDQTVIINYSQQKMKRSSSDKERRSSPSNYRNLRKYKPKYDNQDSLIRKKPMLKPSFILSVPAKQKSSSIREWEKKEISIIKQVQQNREMLAGRTESNVLKMIEQRSKNRNLLTQQKLRAVVHEEIEAVVKKSMIQYLDESKNSQVKPAQTCARSIQTLTQKVQLPSAKLTVSITPPPKSKVQTPIIDSPVELLVSNPPSVLLLQSNFSKRQSIEEKQTKNLFDVEMFSNSLYRINLKSPQGVTNAKDKAIIQNLKSQFNQQKDLQTNAQTNKQNQKRVQIDLKKTESSKKKTSLDLKANPMTSQLIQSQGITYQHSVKGFNKQNPDKSRSLNTSINKKILKKSKVVVNEAILDISQDIDLDIQKNQNNDNDKKFEPATLKAAITLQELGSRLELIPYISDFLEKNLIQMEEAWKKFDLMCWSRYFDLKINSGLDNGDFLQFKKKCKNIKFDAKEILSGLQSNIDEIKITSVKKKKKNMMIMKYLVLHTTQLIILIQGDKIKQKQSIYSHKELDSVIEQLERDELPNVYKFLREKVTLLKKCSL